MSNKILFIIIEFALGNRGIKIAQSLMFVNKQFYAIVKKIIDEKYLENCKSVKFGKQDSMNHLYKLLRKKRLYSLEILYLSENDDYWMHGKCKGSFEHDIMEFHYNKLTQHIVKKITQYKETLTEEINTFCISKYAFDFKTLDIKGRIVQKINETTLTIYTHNTKYGYEYQENLNNTSYEYKIALKKILKKYKDFGKWIPHYLEMKKLIEN
jgi:hypothetical protein